MGSEVGWISLIFLRRGGMERDAEGSLGGLGESVASSLHWVSAEEPVGHPQQGT